MNRHWLMLAAIGGGSGVALGAFAAHGLRASMSSAYLDVFQTGVHYQLAHSLALLALSGYSEQLGKLGKWAGWAFVSGVLLFSGSLYLLTVLAIPKLGMITPLGGLAFLFGWICLFMAAWRKAE
ncbi:DUF423 domain-containing protein [Chitinimonas sp. BJB300]|uniref:DUF423 domain-containing protein n=1 Tax=Chitinimonas sp. BJB300 TaxID=1559339 RepID=UPI000C0EE23E|nr:DUF423 domain-containing protein [Chitinimonas sp. BJB300]PHV11420.1 hypothetical protein CSQ89_10885 [Chitinimonas sp. BJB300]TSJ91489.1 DUF423 domain-containing protein [Chitinimonas sp. BJB300]